MLSSGRIWNEDKGEWVNRPPINESLNVSRHGNSGKSGNNSNLSKVPTKQNLANNKTSIKKSDKRIYGKNSFTI